MFLLQIVNSISVWLKRLAVKGSYAIAFLNEDDQGRAMPFDIHLGDIGLTNANGYNVTDVFDNVHRGQFKPESVLSVLIDPTSIVILKAVPLWATNSLWLLFFLLLGWVLTHMEKSWCWCCLYQHLNNHSNFAWLHSLCWALFIDISFGDLDVIPRSQQHKKN